MLTIVTDDQMLDLAEPYLFVWNCVFITQERVVAAVFSESEPGWYRVYSEPRDDAVLIDAYEAIRSFRDNETLFDRYPLTLDEAIFVGNRPTGAETSGYEAGDSFECPVCSGTHTVQFEEDEIMKSADIDTSQLYVECPDSRRGELPIEYQAQTST